MTAQVIAGPTQDMITRIRREQARKRRKAERRASSEFTYVRDGNGRLIAVVDDNGDSFNPIRFE